MNFVVTLSGSPHPNARSGALLERVVREVRGQGCEVISYHPADFPPEALVYADFKHEQVRRLQRDVARADGVIIATPVYKAAYSGALKLLLDLLPQRGLERALVLPIASGGSLAHMLAIDYALRPVLSALKARHVLDGVYAVESELSWAAPGELAVTDELRERLDEAVQRFVAQLPTAAARSERSRLPRAVARSVAALAVAS